MSDKRIERYSRDRLPTGRTDWRRVDALTDAEVESSAAADPDAPPTDPAFWRDARATMPSAAGKEPITLRIDRDTVKWFKARGHGYQTRMNAVLRAYMLARKKASGR